MQLLAYGPFHKCGNMLNMWAQSILSSTSVTPPHKFVWHVVTDCRTVKSAMLGVDCDGIKFITDFLKMGLLFQRVALSAIVAFKSLFGSKLIAYICELSQFTCETPISFTLFTIY